MKNLRVGLGAIDPSESSGGLSGRSASIGGGVYPVGKPESLLVGLADESGCMLLVGLGPNNGDVDGEIAAREAEGRGDLEE